MTHLESIHFGFNAFFACAAVYFISWLVSRVSLSDMPQLTTMEFQDAFVCCTRLIGLSSPSVVSSH